MSGSRTIIAKEDRLDNVHPGDVLRLDFLIGDEISVDEVIAGSGVDREKFDAILKGKASVDAEIDIRLTRYFGMSEGFFLGLQNDYDLEEAWYANAADFDQIVRRAA